MTISILIFLLEIIDAVSMELRFEGKGIVCVHPSGTHDLCRVPSDFD
jgi:phosphomannomutase